MVSKNGSGHYLSAHICLCEHCYSGSRAVGAPSKVYRHIKMRIPCLISSLFAENRLIGCNGCFATMLEFANKGTLVSFVRNGHSQILYLTESGSLCSVQFTFLFVLLLGMCYKCILSCCFVLQCSVVHKVIHHSGRSFCLFLCSFVNLPW